MCSPCKAVANIGFSSCYLGCIILPFKIEESLVSNTMPNKLPKRMVENMADSKKKETELKEVVRKMLSAGKPLNYANIERESGLSRAFVEQNPKNRQFIDEQIKKQEEENSRVDIELQNFNYHTKLMASYIFAYSLLDEQEEFYKTAIQELKDKETPFVINNGSDSAIEFICQLLSKETNSAKIIDSLNKFKTCFSQSIPNWKEQLIDKLGECSALDILRSQKYK